jgi:hypothetical protein
VRAVVLAWLFCGCSAAGDSLRAIQTAYDIAQLATVPVRTAEAVGELHRCAAMTEPACRARPDLAPYLRGTVVLSGPLGLEAVPFVEIVLQREGRTIAKGATDRSGVFVFTAGVPAGDYELVVDSGHVQGARRVFISGPLRDVLLMAAVTP